MARPHARHHGRPCRTGDVPGIVTLVSRRGEVLVGAIGMKAFDGSEPMGHDTIFRIASVTEPIVDHRHYMQTEQSGDEVG